MVIEESVLIKSDIELIWKTFIDLSRWDEWNTVARETTSRSGLIAEGERFTFTLSFFSVPILVEPEVREVVPREKIVWISFKFGIFSRHEFQFQQVTNGVIVTSHEAFGGLPLLLGGVAFPEGTVRKLTIGMLNDLSQAVIKDR
jgi:hypothetical protein